MCDVINGGTPKSKIKEYWKGHVLWVTPKDLGMLKYRYIKDTPRKITDLGLQKSSAKLFPANSVILSTRAPIGHLAINLKEMSTNQGCRGIVPNANINTEYLYYFLSNSIKLLNHLGTGATFKELSTNSLKSVLIPIPSLTKQKRIVKILDKAFAAIDKAKENAEKNLQNSKELFDSYLQGVFAEPGKDWEICNLEDYVKFIDYRGRTPNKTTSGMRLITAKNVKKNVIQIEPKEFVDPNIYDSWMVRGIPKKGDVLFTTEAPLANVAQLDTSEKVIFSQRIIIFQPKTTKLDQTFLKYLLLSLPIQKKIHDKGTGATVKGIKAKLLKKIEIYFPSSIKEQKQIVSKLDSLTTEIKRLESIYQQKLDDLEELKKSVLRKAFEGEL